MEISPNVALRPEPDRKSADVRFQQQWEQRLNELKAGIAERPFLYAGIVFVAGFLSNTYPARILFQVLARLISWFSVPAILLLGVVKLSNLLSIPKRNEPTILQRS